MIKPSREEYENLAPYYDLIPIYEEISAAFTTPLSAFSKLKGSAKFLLESVERGKQVGRYSFVGFNPSLIFQAQQGVVSIITEQEKKEYCSEDPLKDLEHLLGCRKSPEYEDLPRFSGGAVGYLGYNMTKYWEETLRYQEKPEEYPDCVFMLADTLIIFDHVQQTMKIVANIPGKQGEKGSYAEGIKIIKEIKNKLQEPLDQSQLLPQQNKIKHIELLEDTCQEAEFQEMVKKAQEYILAGDIFQVVLARKTKFKVKEDPLQIYISLRNLNPSPYMFYLQFADLHLIGSSPEVLVKVEEGQAELNPIAGTRPRGRSLQEDAENAQDLLADEKERAEHLMLVDLARNDLGRVCEFGSVAVEEFMQVEYYSHVMHMVSRVKGVKKKDCTSFDVLRAVFPAGTVSGAPKIRAIEIIDELEQEGRGPYAGAVGWFSYTGNMDSCITIRTLFIKGEKGYLQAGAGIVADSDPRKEYQETKSKAQALLLALQKGVEDSDFSN